MNSSILTILCLINKSVYKRFLYDWCANFCGEGVAWSAQWIPTDVNLSIQDQICYFSIQVAPQLSSWGWVDPFQTSYFSQNLVAPGIPPGTFGSAARNSAH
jgi:hypothetical protein